MVGGCTAMPASPLTCEQFEQSRRSVRLDTLYRYSDADTRLAAKSFTPIGSNETIAARWYTLRSNRPVIQKCDYLYLTKDLYLLRRPEASATLQEHREFYTAAGRLIATKREDVTGQLKQPGFYTASVPLPIPKEAPAGAYRIVTKLVAKAPDGSERALATTTIEFRVQ